MSEPNTAAAERPPLALYGWVIEYGRDYDGTPLTIFLPRARRDKAYVDETARRKHGVIVEVFHEVITHAVAA
jgi:hypothetical protein